MTETLDGFQFIMTIKNLISKIFRSKSKDLGYVMWITKIKHTNKIK